MSLPDRGTGAIDGKGGGADDDVEKVEDRPSVGRPLPADAPGAEPEGLSRTDSRAALVGANRNSRQEVGEAADDDEMDTPESAEDPPGDQEFSSDVENDEECDATADSSEEQPDDAGKAETTDSGWEAPGVAEDARRPDAESIHIDEDRRGHILDGESGSRGGHRHGTGRPGKTEFPADWDDDTATDHIVDVGRKPDTVEMQDNGRWRAQGERDGVQITAIIRPDGRIWTAWPEPGGKGVVENPRES